MVAKYLRELSHVFTLDANDLPIEAAQLGKNGRKNYIVEVC